MRFYLALLLFVFLSSLSNANEISVQLSKRGAPELDGKCQLCHLKKQKIKIPGIKKLKTEHQQFSTLHGTKNISCNSCHDVNSSNYLRSNKFFPASFLNSSPVCQQCHADQYGDWLIGLHGRRTGFWSSNQIQLHCIDCHDPHSVTFKKMDAISTPNRPGQVVEDDN